MEWDKSWYCSGEQLKKQIETAETGEESFAFWYIGQCGMILKYAGKIWMIDPVLTEVKDEAGISRKHYEAPFSPEDSVKPDVVFCTHDHLDHLNLETLTRLHRAFPDTKFAVPQAFAEKLCRAGIRESQVAGARQGEWMEILGPVKTLPVAVPHDSYAWDEEGNSLALGYVWKIGPYLVFHGGDLVADEKVAETLEKLAEPLSVCFLPVNGRDWLREAEGIIGNMNPLEAARFAGRLRADLTIPTHFDMMKGNEEDPLIFAGYMERFCPGRRYHILKLGEGYLYQNRRF